MHFAITPIVLGVPAGCIDHNRPAGGASRRVEINFAAFQLEGPVHGVKCGVQRESNFGVRGVEFKHRVLREYRPYTNNRHQCYQQVNRCAELFMMTNCD